MTVIVYRDGVMAADTSAWFGRFLHRWSNKMTRLGNGFLYGVAGECSEGQAFLRGLENGLSDNHLMPRLVDGNASFAALRAYPSGEISVLEHSSGWERFDAPYYAIGGGCGVALGALYAGASAVEAVRAAIEHSDSAAGDVITMTHDKGDAIRYESSSFYAPMRYGCSVDFRRPPTPV